MLKKLFKALCLICACCPLLWAAIGVQVTPNKWEIGEGGFSEWTSPDFTVTNIGNETAKVNIRATDTLNWTLGSGPGIDVFSLRSSLDKNSWTLIQKTNTQIHQGLDGQSSFNFNMKFLSPGSLLKAPSYYSTQYSTITVSVAAMGIGYWDITLADPTLSAAVCSVGMDSYDRPHVVFNKNQTIMHARWTGSEWNTETVSAAGTVSYFSFKIDANDTLHIITSSNEGMKYLRRESQATEWSVTVIDPTAATSNSIYIDSAGQPQITYITRYYIRYAKYSGGSWTTEDIVAITWGRVGSGISIITDSNNIPNIVYCDSSYSIKHAKRNGQTGSWEVATIDNEGTLYDKCSLVVDTNNNLYAAYNRLEAVTQASIMNYAEYNGTAWSKYTIYRKDYGAGLTSPSIAIKSNGNLGLSLINGSYVMYFIEDGYTWTNTGIPPNIVGQQAFCSLVYDKFSNPVIAATGTSGVYFARWR